jgi:hypothetical protein
MTTVHVLPTGEPPEDHTLGNCACQPRHKQIPRRDGTVEVVHLHRGADDDDPAK